jgi:hypothetical protein
MAIDQELREGFKRILEQEMSGLIHSLDQLIEMHDTYGGTTIQKTYLYKARNALRDGKDWFDWERRQQAMLKGPGGQLIGHPPSDAGEVKSG